MLIIGSWNSSKILLNLKGKYKPEPRLRKYISDCWSKYIERYPKTFNGPMARLLAWKSDKSELKLFLEKTDYSSYIASRDADFTNKFSEKDRANPLGVAIIITTSDHKLIVGRRSLLADQNAGRLYFIGGYLHVGGASKRVNLLEQTVISEIKEELNIDKKNIASMFIKCLAYETIYYHPEIFVSVQLRVDSNKIGEIWYKAKDSREIDKLFFYDKDDLIKRYKNNKLPYEKTWGFEVAMKYCIPSS